MITERAPRAVYATGAGGPPVPHDVQFRDAPPGIPGFRPPAEIAFCGCGWSRVIDGGHSDEEKARLKHQHETGEP